MDGFYQFTSHNVYGTCEKWAKKDNNHVKNKKIKTMLEDLFHCNDYKLKTF